MHRVPVLELFFLLEWTEYLNLSDDLSGNIFVVIFFMESSPVGSYIHKSFLENIGSTYF